MAPNSQNSGKPDGEHQPHEQPDGTSAKPGNPATIANVSPSVAALGRATRALAGVVTWARRLPPCGSPVLQVAKANADSCRGQDEPRPQQVVRGRLGVHCGECDSLKARLIGEQGRAHLVAWRVVCCISGLVNVGGARHSLDPVCGANPILIQASPSAPKACRNAPAQRGASPGRTRAAPHRAPQLTGALSGCARKRARAWPPCRRRPDTRYRRLSSRPPACPPCRPP